MHNAEYYRSVSSDIKFPFGNFINGEFVAAASGKTVATINPATKEKITDISSSSEDDVNRAVQCAKDALKKGVWSDLHPSKRKEILVRFAQLINEHTLELAILESLDSGKPISDCLNVDVPETARCIAWHAEAQDKLFDQLAPNDSSAVGMIVREPIGVVGVVLPWNFPLLMAAWKLGPALATGNSVVVKPSEMTSLSTLKLAELGHEAGIPAGVLNVVTGSGRVVGHTLGMHDDVDGISFTGSTFTGRKFLEYSAQSNMKRIVLETGGKSPCVIFDDADLEKAAEQIAYSFLGNMGQTCTANTRLIVHSSQKDALLDLLKKECDNWAIGNPLDPDTCLGPLVSESHFNKVRELIQQGQDEGAKVIYGNEEISSNGYFLKPVIFDEVTSEMVIGREEVFGPVLTVFTFETEEEAITLANDTEYGLAASVFTKDLARTHRVSRQIQAGTVSVNCYSEGDITTPFGGYKLSGFGGKDNGIDAHDQYSEKKTIWIDLT
jgi:gamma-glutamyl-gamma-aminobutyraldehyde dehydrogenase